LWHATCYLLAVASIRRLPSGRYRVRWRDPSGTERGRTFARAKEAQRFKIDTEHDAIRGQFRDPRAGQQPFGTYLLEQLDRAEELAPATRALYLSVAKNHVIPRVGHKRLAGITRPDLKALYTSLSGDGAGAQTIKVVHRLISRTLSEAVADGDLEVNPAWRVKTPKVKRRRGRVLTEEEIIKIAVATGYVGRADVFKMDKFPGDVERQTKMIRAARDAERAGISADFETLLEFVHIDSPFFVVLVAGYSGLRFEELAALRWDRVHLGGRPFIQVTEAAAEVAGRVTIGPTKTDGSRRAVPIPGWLAWLFAHLFSFQSYVGDPDEDQLVFTTPKGHVLSRTRFRARVWVPAVELAKVRPVPTFHDLRRSYASRLIKEQRVNPKVLQTRMGHSSIRTTFDVYGDLMPDDDVARMWHEGESAAWEENGSDASYPV
jgi:integrase